MKGTPCCVIKRNFFSRAESLDCAIANLEVIGLHSFRCYRHVDRFAEFDPSVFVFLHCQFSKSFVMVIGLSGVQFGLQSYK